MAPRVVVIGGGVSGLGAAWRLAQKRPDAHITVLEASTRFGGKLISEHRDGFVVEGAADGFLARKPPALDWANELGLASQLIEPRPEHRFSHVWWNGELHRLPEGFSGLVPSDPEALARSTLLTPEGASRAAAEPTVPFQRDGAEESVAQFFTRRFGAEAFERLMEPLLAGIFAGDADKLSAQAAFGQLVERERQGQSLMAGPSAPGAPSFGPAFRSFAPGMAALPEALRAACAGLGVHLIAGQPVTSVGPRGSGFLVTTHRGLHEADAVICALPPRAAGDALMQAWPHLGGVLCAWPTSSVANLALAFDEAELPGLPPGSGFVAPRAGRTVFSAATWSSRKWPGRAPEGRVLVRVYFGGARAPEAWNLGEAELTGAALDLLAKLCRTGTRPRPLWHRVFRWKDAFAQPDLGHAERHRALEAGSVPGLVLAGGYFAGVGIPDCLARAETAAHLAAQHLDSIDPSQGALA